MSTPTPPPPPERPLDPAQVIAASLADIAGAYDRRPYSGQLPDELRPWLVYTIDGGYSLLVVVISQVKLTRYTDALAPAPVKAVLRAGYSIDQTTGLVFCDLPYDDALGLVTAPEDDEY